MNVKPMLRRGHYVVQQADGEYYYGRVSVKETPEGLEILKGPPCLSDRSAYIVVSSKTVYQVNRNDFFRIQPLGLDRRLSADAVRTGFVKQTVGGVLSSVEDAIEGAASSEAGGVSVQDQFGDELLEAGNLIKDQIEVLRG